MEILICWNSSVSEILVHHHSDTLQFQYVRSFSASKILIITIGQKFQHHNFLCIGIPVPWTSEVYVGNHNMSEIPIHWK